VKIHTRLLKQYVIEDVTSRGFLLIVISPTQGITDDRVKEEL
jgi:hypothetical protein